ncbi:MAG: prepilin-type N-terminal cleavage/methylation domain-containing protein [Planctomycetes bacterium]|nr:prepilin-type N-terminal cleavage/methylation domain-containing protein [Planctomycetota bacterium]
MGALRTSPRSAFTLVELMLVVLALAMLSTIVYVSWEALLPRTKLNSAVRELAAVLQETRSDAISRGLEFRVEYYFEADEEHPRGYRVITPFRAGGVGGLAAWDEDRLALEWRPLPANIEFRSITINGEVFMRGRCEVRFDARGSATDHMIQLIQRPYDNVYTIEVQALTGLIQFHDGEFARAAPDDKDFQ